MQRVKRHTVVQPPDPSYRLIALTQGQNAIVDAADYDWLMQWRWYAFTRSRSQGFYAARGDRTEDRHFTVLLHRFIMNPSDGMHVDHWNMDSLDCRRANLRICTRSQNLGNMLPHKDGKKRFKGITWVANERLWYVHGGIQGKHVNIGYFRDEIEAAKAYDIWALQVFGDFARLNFPSTQHSQAPARLFLNVVSPEK